MADFTRQHVFRTREPVLMVDKGLQPGIHTFQLVVEDGSGNRSKAVQVKVEIVRILEPITTVTRITATEPLITAQPIIRRGPVE